MVRAGVILRTRTVEVPFLAPLPTATLMRFGDLRLPCHSPAVKEGLDVSLDIHLDG